MTQYEVAIERLLQSIAAETRKPDCYVPEPIVSAYLNVLAIRRDHCMMCGDSE